MKRVMLKTQQLIGPVSPSVRRCGHRLVFVLILGCLLVTAPNQVEAQPEDSKTQNLIRSAMIYNFCKFVQWPENAPADSIVLGVIGDPNTASNFSSLIGKSVSKIPIAVRVVDSQEDLMDCQLVYIAQDVDGLTEAALALAESESILTISDLEGFCGEGGIIQLVERRGKLRFFINRQAADRAQLSLSSQLLKVAKIVEGG